MTRAFKLILSFHFLEAFSYNIMAIPFFVLLIIWNCFMLFDCFFKRNYIINFYNFINKYIYIFIILVVTSEIVNLFRI